jgi:FSR family fosmidomycin resistance protein-like MFS transporter
MEITRKLIPAAYLSGLGHFAIEFCVNSLPILYPLLIISMGLSYAQVGAIVFVLSMGSTLTQPFFGYLSDRWDKRSFLVFSVAWAGVFMGLVGLMKSYWMLILIVGLASLGSAAFHPSAAVVAASGHDKNRGAFVAIFSVSGTLGTALSPLIIGMLVTGLGVKATLILPPVALSSTLLLLSQFRSYPAIYNQTADATHEVATQKSKNSALMLALVVLTVGARSWFHGSVVTYLPVWLQSLGLPLSSAATYLSVLMVMVSVGSLAGGTISDLFGRTPIAVASFILLGPAFWLVLNMGGVFQLISAGVAGFILGLTFPITILLAQEAWPKGVGFASSLVLGLGWMPFGLGSWVLGALADRTSLSFAMGTLPFIPLIALVMVSAAGYFSTRLRRMQVAVIAEKM